MILQPRSPPYKTVGEEEQSSRNESPTQSQAKATETDQ